MMVLFKTPAKLCATTTVPANEMFLFFVVVLTSKNCEVGNIDIGERESTASNAPAHDKAAANESCRQQCFRRLQSVMWLQSNIKAAGSGPVGPVWARPTFGAWWVW